MRNKLFVVTSSLSALFLVLTFFAIVVIPEHPLVYQSLILLFVSSIILNIWIKKDEIIHFIKSRYWKNLSTRLVSVFLFFCVLALVNYIGVKKTYIFDMSDRKLNSLSDQTLKVLEYQVREEVEFIIFSSQNNRKRIVKFLELFKNYNQKIKIEYYDPILRPDLTQKYGVVQAPSIVIKGKKDKYIVVTDLRELAVTNGLIRLFREKDPILCFIKDDIFTKTGETGYSNFFNLLNQSSFIVRQVDLLKEIEIPKRCNALLSWAMSRDLLDDEIKKIKDYYESGGIVVGTFSPMFKDDRHLKMRSLFKEEKLFVQNDIVIDAKNNIAGSNGSAPFVATFDPLTINIDKGQKVFFPLSNSVSSIDKNEDFIPLASTSSNSWAENTLIEMLADSLKFDDKDIPGPIHMAGAIVNDKRPKLVALGNSNLVSNKFIKFSTNFTFVLNIFHWIAGEDTLTSLNAVVFKEEPLFIGDTQRKLILFVSVIGLPIIFLFMAIFQYRRRRV
ncbi:MAG: Gldg family protein [Bdellovibrionota bacterium]|nr:Gldg family protein [Bdellovibrionota bacterium]